MCLVLVKGFLILDDLVNLNRSIRICEIFFYASMVFFYSYNFYYCDDFLKNGFVFCFLFFG